MSEENEKTFIFEHVTIPSDIHIPSKPLKNKIVFYKGKYTTKYEITLIPTIGIDINQPQITYYRSKNLTIRIEWLGFHLFFGWRQTYPKWKVKT